MNKKLTSSHVNKLYDVLSDWLKYKVGDVVMHRGKKESIDFIECYIQINLEQKNKISIHYNTTGDDFYITNDPADSDCDIKKIDAKYKIKNILKEGDIIQRNGKKYLCYSDKTRTESQYGQGDKHPTYYSVVEYEMRELKDGKITENKFVLTDKDKPFEVIKTVKKKTTIEYKL